MDTQKLPMAGVVSFLVLFTIMLGLCVAVVVKESRRAADREAEHAVRTATRDNASTPARMSEIPASTSTEASRPAPALTPEPIVRELTADAWREIAAAFYENPTAAAKRYAGVRWRFTGYTDKFVTRDIVLISAASVGAESVYAAVEMRAGEINKVARGKKQKFEATLVDCTLGQVPNSVFRDAVLIAD